MNSYGYIRLTDDERRMIQNYGPTTRIEESLVPEAYRNNDYVAGQRKYVDLLVNDFKREAEFYFTWIPPQFVTRVDLLAYRNYSWQQAEE
jgi:hypothetical protein